MCVLVWEEEGMDVFAAQQVSSWLKVRNFLGKDKGLDSEPSKSSSFPGGNCGSLSLALTRSSSLGSTPRTLHGTKGR